MMTEQEPRLYCQKNIGAKARFHFLKPNIKKKNVFTV